MTLHTCTCTRTDTHRHAQIPTSSWRPETISYKGTPLPTPIPGTQWGFVCDRDHQEDGNSGWFENKGAIIGGILWDTIRQKLTMSFEGFHSPHPDPWASLGVAWPGTSASELGTAGEATSSRAACDSLPMILSTYCPRKPPLSLPDARYRSLVVFHPLVYSLIHSLNSYMLSICCVLCP